MQFPLGPNFRVVVILCLSRGLWGVLGYEVDLAEDAGGDGFDLVEVLHLEAVSILCR